jgi:hemoglobin
MNKPSTLPDSPKITRLPVSLISLALLTSVLLFIGCGGGAKQKQNKEFFTSGSREADQRASQRMAQQEQLSGSGEGSGEKGVKKAKSEKSPLSPTGATNKAAQVEGKLALFDRLGGETGMVAIIEDFLPRAMQDPRVNWPRKGVKRGGFSLGRHQEPTWAPTPENVATLKKHMVQFLVLATGGPAHYEGKEMKPSHDGMQITNPEFDATIGDLKASLDKLQIPNKEQKELLAIVESTRPLIVEKR